MGLFLEIYILALRKSLLAEWCNTHHLTNWCRTIALPSSDESQCLNIVIGADMLFLDRHRPQLQAVVIRRSSLQNIMSVQLASTFAKPPTWRAIRLKHLKMLSQATKKKKKGLECQRGIDGTSCDGIPVSLRAKCGVALSRLLAKSCGTWRRSSYLH